MNVENESVNNSSLSTEADNLIAQSESVLQLNSE